MTRSYRTNPMTSRVPAGRCATVIRFHPPSRRRPRSRGARHAPRRGRPRGGRHRRSCRGLPSGRAR
ncbi:hypothetical protein DBB34_01825 [Sphaerisporangium cinnabarinum]|nr:hypothetical protein DBB34_01825 [Sphaerisporangium cinnabarinum]